MQEIKLTHVSKRLPSGKIYGYAILQWLAVSWLLYRFSKPSNEHTFKHVNFGKYVIPDWRFIGNIRLSETVVNYRGVQILENGPRDIQS